MLPLKDNLPTSRLPVVTIALIAINLTFFIWQLSFSGQSELEGGGFSNLDQSAISYGAIPHRITHPGGENCAIAADATSAEIVCQGTAAYEQAREDGSSRSEAFIPLDQAAWYVTLFTSMFMHGGILHIAGNMLFLWVFGNNIEDSMGRLKFILFYLLAGLAAVYAQAGLDTGSTVPTIGASGAVAGVLGAYALLYPRAKVLTLIFIILFVTVIEIPALILLGLWFALQFLPAVGQFATPELGGGGVAYLAHVGGFLFGLAAIKLFADRRSGREPRPPAYQ